MFIKGNCNLFHVSLYCCLNNKNYSHSHETLKYYGLYDHFFVRPLGITVITAVEMLMVKQ